MRMLVRWSESSLSMTTPRPENAEPSRCMAGPVLFRSLRRRLEIARIDRLEARLLHAEIFQAALHSHHLGRGFRPDISVGLQAKLIDAGFLDPADARNNREPLGEAVALGLDLDNVAAAEHLPPKLCHRTHQGNVPAVKQRNAITNALHPLKQMRGEQNRHTFT